MFDPVPKNSSKQEKRAEHMENIRSVRKRTQIFSSFHFRRSLSIIVQANAVVKAYFVPTVPEIIR